MDFDDEDEDEDEEDEQEDEEEDGNRAPHIVAGMNHFRWFAASAKWTATG